jgi:hypothetical protein
MSWHKKPRVGRWMLLIVLVGTLFSASYPMQGGGIPPRQPKGVPPGTARRIPPPSGETKGYAFP